MDDALAAIERVVIFDAELARIDLERFHLGGALRVVDALAAAIFW
jgi:hypothetical protein